MPNTREIVRALVSAFNVHNYARNTVKTNFTLQSRYGKDCIVVSFDKGMEDYQCSEYLYNIKRKIVGEFYGIEEGDTDEVVLNTAKLIFDVKSFPFNDYKGDWSVGKQGRIEFVAPIDQGVIFNLKSHLASSLVKDVLEDMPTCSIVTNSFNKEKYLCHSKFPNKKLRKEFEREFLSRMRERYENAPKNPLGGGDNSVYIRDVFDDACFIDSVTRHVAWLVGMDLQADSKNYSEVKAFKDLIIEFIDQPTGIIVDGFVCASPLGREVASILVPIMRNGKGGKLLTKEDARTINRIFNYVVLNDLYGRTQGELSINKSGGMYSIDFSDREISHCVITKIIESSVINKDHELSIDPELHFRALSPVLPGTPPNQRNRDSGIGESPLKLEDFGVQSPVGMPNGPSSGLTELSSPIQEFPTQSQGEELGGSPRQGSKKEVLLYNHVDVPGTSGASWPSSSLRFVSSAQNVPAAQPQVRWSSPAPSAEPSLWQPSRPSSWKGANESGSAWTSQPIDSWSSPAPSAEPPLWQPSRPSSWKGANESGSACTSQPIGFWSSSTPSAGPSLWQPSGPSSSEDANKSMRIGKSTWYVSSSHSPSVEDVNDVEPEKQQVNDECSEAKSQESESSKKHGSGTILSKIFSPFKRNNKKRSSTSSSVSAPVTPVTEKPPVSKSSSSFPGRIRAESNPPSEVTSPTHEGGSEWQQRLNPDQREELHPFLSPELQNKLNSNSFSPEEEQRLYLMYTLSGKRELRRSLCESEESQLRRLAEAQLSSPDNSSSKKVDRDSGFCSMGSPAAQHKGSVPSKESVPSEVKECEVEPVSEALRK